MQTYVPESTSSEQQAGFLKKIKIKIKKLKKYSFDVLSNISKSSLQGAEAKDKWKIGPWPLFYSNIAVALFMSGRL